MKEDTIDTLVTIKWFTFFGGFFYLFEGWINLLPIIMLAGILCIVVFVIIQFYMDKHTLHQKRWKTADDLLEEILQD